MDADRKWVIVRIDGKIAAISTDYRLLASISAGLSAGSHIYKDRNKVGRTRQKTEGVSLYKEISAVTVGFEEVWKLRQELKWEDMMLYGTDFQKAVWRKLWELTHHRMDGDEVHGAKGVGGKIAEEQPEARLISYSDFAGLCSNRAGVRAVAHAIGLNPVSIVIPCHLVIPKESIDKITDIQKKAESTIFKGDDLCLNSILNDSSIDFGEYSHGRELKRMLIRKELTGF